MLSKLALLVNNSLWIHLICESGEVVAREVGMVPTYYNKIILLGFD